MNEENLKINLKLACDEIKKNIEEGVIKQYYCLLRNRIEIKSLLKDNIKDITTITDIPIWHEGKQEFITIYDITFKDNSHDTVISFV